ncbi:hypothetical protein [Candidatus Clostridium radicumherbarum]|uniref:Uncharacterized protein n=1 Tax=Candidatus Clostridium radicumherbarum TaxID=3381662 RepID=A0ABW8TNH4_9CLOT
MAQPHFINAKGSIDNKGVLTVTFKEAGLGDNVLIDYTLSASAMAVYQCVNNGGGCPQAANKQTATGPVSSTGSFSSGKNGQVTASLQVSPPQVNPFCPNGQHQELLDVSYTGVTLKDDTNNVIISVSGTFSKTFNICKK